jgi:hypothetical protein
MSALVASGTRSPFKTSREIRACSPGGPEPGGYQQGAELVTVQCDSMRLVIHPRPPDMRGRGVIQEVFLHGVLAEPGDGAQPPGERGASAAFRFQVASEAFDVGAADGEQGETAGAAPVGELAQVQGVGPVIPSIPVAFTTFAVGQALYTQAQQSPAVSLSIPAVVKPNTPDYNVIAESKGGSSNHVVVVDAHLDAIYGAGMLDNASGSATILAVAQQMKNVNPLNKLRFIWFGGEELGLLGSTAYINSLSSTDKSHIGYDLDADVTATPNYTIGVLDPAGPDLFTGTVSSTFPNRVYKASTVARDQAITYFDSIGKNHELFSPVGTDAFNFNQVGIPASGLLTGQDCCKNQHEVDLFGGSLGNFEGNVPSFDGGCVDNPFRWCDNLSNNDPNVLTFMSKAFATMVVQMAFDTKVMSASNNAVYNKKLPIASEASRQHPAK